MNALQTTLKQLRLSGLSQTLDVRLQEAAANRLSHAEFLELICQDELNVRQQRQMERHTKLADFRHLKTLEDFDWSFNPSVHKKENSAISSRKCRGLACGIFSVPRNTLGIWRTETAHGLKWSSPLFSPMLSLNFPSAFNAW